MHLGLYEYHVTSFTSRTMYGCIAQHNAVQSFFIVICATTGVDSKLVELAPVLEHC